MTSEAIDLLSLPRQAIVNYANINIPELGTGLPINSLPGWESIPMNSKLPMLKCPGQQVIFTKAKIGKSMVNRLEQDFDTKVEGKIPEYNPLHDDNLKNFYSNENNLKFLRENGEITEDNDVICTLKDFNEHRQEIHKSYIYYMMRLQRMADYALQDKHLIENAEDITNYDYENLHRRSRSVREILHRRNVLAEEKAKRKLLAVQKTEERIQQIAEKKKLLLDQLEEKKIVHDLIIKQHQEARDECTRKKLILVKKMHQLKKVRYLRSLRAMLEKKNNKYNPEELEKWKVRLEKRVAFQKYINQLIEQRQQEHDEHVELHKQAMKEKWDQIQLEIKRRKMLNRCSKKLRKNKLFWRPSVDYIYGGTVITFDDKDLYSDSDVPLQGKKPGVDSCKNEDNLDYALERGIKEPMNICELQRIFENMMDYEVCTALHNIMDIDADPTLPFDDQDPSYKLANFIITNVILTHNKDMTVDKDVFKMITARMIRYFEEIKTAVLQRARQIIASIQSGHSFSEFNAGRFQAVSFKRYSSTIGQSSYEINPNVEVRRSSKRKPTPAGSLASILAAEPQLPAAHPVDTPRITRNDAVFIEYSTVKFKRELTVRVGQKVNSAIQQFFAGRPEQVRKDLLDMDKNYLAKVGAEGVLLFNICNLNFYSALSFCSSVLSTEALWLLYRQVLRKDRDSRGIKKHKRFKNDWVCLMYEEKLKQEVRCVPKKPTEGLFGQK